MNQPPTALVLGASGRVGRPLCEALIGHCWCVHGAARFRDAAKREALVQLGVETISFDAQQDDAAALPDADTLFLEIWDPRHIVGEHLEDCWSLNFDAIGRVVQRYADVADVINGSTVSLYGPRTDRPSCESDPPRPTPGRDDVEYSLARAAQERLIDFLCDGTRSRVCHLRYCRSNDETSGAFRRMADCVLAGRSLGDAPDERTQLIGLTDFVRCTLLAAEAKANIPPIVNVCHPRAWTMRSLAQHIRDELGCGEIVFDQPEGGAAQSLWLSADLMIETFGPPTEDLDDLIARTCRRAKSDAGAS